MRGAPPPVLDLRDDDQILVQLRRLAALHVPEWKGDLNVKPDAGTTLLRIFARLMEITLKRLNKVPEKNFFAFLNATGISLLPPVPAQVPLTFTLTSGSSPVFVPRGTRAGTTPQGDQQPVDFETAADLTVIPGTLAATWTMDPGWDRYADHFGLIDRSSGIGFTPFVGSQRVPHALYLGDERLLDFKLAKVTLTFARPEGQEVQSLLQSIEWRYRSGGQVVDDLNFATLSANGRVEIHFKDPLGQIDQTIVGGTSETLSLRQGVRNCWLQATLKEPLAENPDIRKLIFKDVQLKVSGNNVFPDLAFSNTLSVDVTTPFHPFGEAPKAGDAFYLSCSEALAKPNVALKLAFQVARTQIAETTGKPVLKWEAFGDAGWTPFEGSNVEDHTNSLSTSGLVTLRSASAILGKVNGKEGCWIRVRIYEGDYGKVAEYVEVTSGDPSKGYKLKEGTGHLAPPLVAKLTLTYTAQGIPQSLVTQDGFLLTDQSVANADGFYPFVAIQGLMPSIYADAAPSLYLGFDRVFPEEPMTLFFVVAPRALPGTSSTEPGAIATESSVPPSLRWEYFNGASWVELSVLDQTGQFAQSGTVDILTPTDIAPLARFDLKEIYWIRAVLAPEGLTTLVDAPFRDNPVSTPRLAAIFLNTIPAVQAVTIENEILGSGNSLPGQTFRLSQSPVLANPEILALEAELPGGAERDEVLKDEGVEAIQQRISAAAGETEIWIRWHEVSSFNGSAPHSRHYTLDHGTGEVVFGDGVRGLVPSLGTDNIVANYRVSAGSAGNVPRGTVAQFKSSIAGIASVANLLDADGGADLETSEIVQQRGPQTLRHRGRAVSRTDFEWLAREAAGTRLARVVCLQNINRNFLPEPGWVTLVIVPHGTERRLVPSVELIRHVEEAVSKRAFAGLDAFNRVNVTGPGYVEVAVAAEVVLDDVRQAAEIKRRVTEALDRFLHPLTGGPQAEGWELGRNVFASEIASAIQAVPGVDYLKSFHLIPNQAQHQIRLFPNLVFSQDLPDGTSIVSMDGHKSALLAEPVPAGIERSSLHIKGFKVGDRIVRAPDSEPDSFNPPFTITSVTVDREKAIQLIGVEPCDFDEPKAGMSLSTPNKHIALPISAVSPGTASGSPAFFTLEDFTCGEHVQILLPNQKLALDPLPQIEAVLPALDVSLGGISLVCSGQHRITISAPKARVAAV